MLSSSLNPVNKIIGIFKRLLLRGDTIARDDLSFTLAKTFLDPSAVAVNVLSKEDDVAILSMLLNSVADDKFTEEH
ncbi:hypothetical protein INT45_007760 [Circinella minor]|uniref:Uncharacterized protein n=1 Tax=Circinella minor TaxID=1195481 RepID=A0A8H7VLT3_9FUNG|nr:hypothetical protein INT45_007760 [Circinella minor]